MKELFESLLKKDDKMHWTTVLTERAIIALIGVCTIFAIGDYVFGMWIAKGVV